MSISNRFVDKKEVAIADLTNGYLENKFSDEEVLEDSVVVTTKRIYYNAKEGLWLRAEEHYKIDVMDVTAIKIVRTKSFAGKIIGAFLAVGCILFGPIPVGILLLLVSVIVDYSISKNYLSVEYAGGHNNFSIRNCSMENVLEFQEAVFRVQDAMKSKN